MIDIDDLSPTNRVSSNRTGKDKKPKVKAQKPFKFRRNVYHLFIWEEIFVEATERQKT
jgi:hypothetical protein